MVNEMGSLLKSGTTPRVHEYVPPIHTYTLTPSAVLGGSPQFAYIGLVFK